MYVQDDRLICFRRARSGSSYNIAHKTTKLHRASNFVFLFLRIFFFTIRTRCYATVRVCTDLFCVVHYVYSVDVAGKGAGWLKTTTRRRLVIIKRCIQHECSSQGYRCRCGGRERRSGGNKELLQCIFIAVPCIYIVHWPGEGNRRGHAPGGGYDHVIELRVLSKHFGYPCADPRVFSDLGRWRCGSASVNGYS